MTAFTAFDRLARQLAPRTAIVLGSGLGGVIEQFQEAASIAYGEIPGLCTTTVSGHPGSLGVGFWDEIPILVFHGRLHFYEGHAPEVVTGIARVAAGLGSKVFVLTNASGAINPRLAPGSLLAISKHIKLIGRDAWRAIVDRTGDSKGGPYSQRLIDRLQSREAGAGRELFSGVYAALTGPSYETPAEIRALGVCGADVVGMSTALEAEAAAELGLEVVGISCITNAAAGLSSRLLTHKEVLDNARLGIQRLEALVGHIVSERARSSSSKN
jgi:purine-nucleoside phosphorylase